ncbi:MAG: hypothetical protein WCJ58_07980 [bacterium]
MPLFTPFVENGLISFCNWNESGTDLKTTVPELVDLVKNKPNWRAVIVYNPIVDENGKVVHASTDENPFDFICNRDGIKEMAESEIPLIRLSQILGGVPYPEVTHDIIIETCESLEEDSLKYKKKFYSIDEKHNPISMKAFEVLTKKYYFPEKRPSEIIILATRTKTEEHVKKEIKAYWDDKLEAESSLFTQRNNYPNACKFIIRDSSKKGNSKFNKGLFEFLLCTLIISINQIKPSSLQAYRVYNIKIKIKEEDLQSIFTNYQIRLKQIRQNVLDKMKIGRKINPDEEVSLTKELIPVIFEQKKAREFITKPSFVGLSQDCPHDAVGQWFFMIRNLLFEVNQFLKRPIRALEASCEFVREKGVVDKHTNLDLNKFQLEDLNEMMDEYELELINSNTKGLLDFEQIKQNILSSDRKIEKMLRNRMTSKSTIITGLFTMGLFFFGFIPYIINYFSIPESLPMAFLLALVSTIFVGVGGIISLLILKGRIVKEIKVFNEIIHNTIKQVNNCAKKFESYLSLICTYMRGKSIISKIGIADKTDSDSKHILRRHNYNISNMLKATDAWARNYGFELKTENIIDFENNFDLEIAPENNPIYFLEGNSKLNQIHINDTGDKIDSPFSFIKNIELMREELFEGGEM